MAKIVVISTSVVKTGTSAKGSPWTLSEVTATRENGEPITEKLKTFDSLPAGVVEVDFERQEHEKYGVSYTLKLKGGGGGGAPRAAAPDPTTAEAIAQLQRRVTALEQRIDSGGTAAAAAPPTPVAGPTFGGDDDIPF